MVTVLADDVRGNAFLGGCVDKLSEPFPLRHAEAFDPGFAPQVDLGAMEDVTERNGSDDAPPACWHTRANLPHRWSAARKPQARTASRSVFATGNDREYFTLRFSVGIRRAYPTPLRASVPAQPRRFWR